MELGLNGKTALVTGASEGIGRAIAVRFAAAGAHVVACARREEPLRDLIREVEALGVKGVAVACDVTDREAPETVLRAAAGLSDVDVLVNNVGRATPRKLLSTSDDEWEAGMEVNFLSAVRFTRACLPGMVERKSGCVVNVSSTTAKLADPYYAIYGAGKAALLNFTKTVSAAFAAEGVRCNAILPGITLTPLIEENIRTAAEKTGRSPEQVMDRMMEKWPIPAGRLGTPEEIAELVAFLCSDRAAWITGVSLPIDGGTIPVVG